MADSGNKDEEVKGVSRAEFEQFGKIVMANLGEIQKLVERMSKVSGKRNVIEIDVRYLSAVEREALKLADKKRVTAFLAEYLRLYLNDVVLLWQRRLDEENNKDSRPSR